jgi:hypothetical protein
MEGDDIVFVENVSSTMDISNDVKEAGAKTCQSNESTKHDREFPAVTELPVRINPGLSGLENDCPPLSSPVSCL